MKENPILSRKGWIAVSFIAILYIVVSLTSKNPPVSLLLAVVAFCTAAITALDSAHIQLRRYRSGIAYGPIGLFLVCALFWPLPVIWYFIVRVRIMRGTMALKAKVGPVAQV
jgi:hypothetical protein